MKRTANLFWGIILILVSVALLADRLGYISFEDISSNVWVWILAGASLLFLVTYFVTGIKNWGWLFPAFIFGALSLTAWMATSGLEGSFLGTPILAAIAIPFYIGFIFNRKDWGLLIPAWILTVLAIITLGADRVSGNWIGSLFLFSAALPFLIVFLRNRSRRWALIPAWSLFILGLITFLTDHINGNLVGALFMYAIALPFLVVYLWNRTHRWALIPAGILAVLGTIPLLSSLVGGDVMGAAVMFLFAVPFFVVYFRWKEQWWALIPAGIFTSIGIVVVLGMVLPKNQPIVEGILNGIVLLGFGVTFGLLWLQRKTIPTDWAKYPAIGLFASAVLAFILGANSQDYGAIVLLVVGILLVVTALLPKKPKDPTSPVNPS